MENDKLTAVEWLYNHLFPKQLDGFSDEEWNKIDEAFKQAKEMEWKQIIDFVYWLTKVDSPYSVMWGCLERFCTEDEDFTIEQVYEEYLKQKEIK